MRFPFAALVAAGVLVVAPPTYAQHGHGHQHKQQSHSPQHEEKEHGVETESLFGFVSGSDIGHKGDRHLIFFYETHFGKREGPFRAQQPKLELGYNPTDWLHVALEVWGDHFRVDGVPGLDDQNRWGAGVAAEFKLQLVKRAPSSPVGVALLVAPHYSNSEHSGEKARHYALELALIADAELIKDRLFAAFNLLYEPARARAADAAVWERESLLGVSGALTARMAPAIFFGGELQYFRAYEGYFFNTFHGHAVYAGPVLTLQISEQASFTLAWAAQVAGTAVDEPGRLDLEHFERHRVKARFSTHF